jgi:RNA-directed DNA polymerase
MEQSVNGTEKQPTDWNEVDWTKASKEVRRLRQRIFQATQEADFKKVRSLQKLMLRSYSNRLLSVRRVSQENAGRWTPGVDKILLKTPRSRGMVVDQLANLTPWKAQPVRRVYIPKANGNSKRPLGIPVIRDRAIQAMVKNALEPCWEARFEATSYGFRPGRGCHDAIMRLVHAANGRATRTWVLDADIQGAFDNISHDYILQTIAGFPARELVKQWLKAGYLEMGTLHATEAGVPQGGVISPLLANIALHGMETALQVKRDSQGVICSACAVLRYADDFLVLCKTKEQAEQARECLTGWLAERGLKFSEEKTRIVHLTEGIDFLGFTLRHYRKPDGRTYLHVRVSDKSMQKERDKIKALWRGLGNKTPGQIAQILNPKIKGWTNYFCIAGCNPQFTALDVLQFRKAWRYGLRRHPRKSKGWIRQRYFGRFHPHRADTWVFGDAEKQGTLYLYKYGWTRAKIHREVQGTASPDDPALKDYWARRQKRLRHMLTPLHKRLARQQEDICPRCGENLLNGERLEVHHIRPKRRGGENDLSNLELLHLLCHQQADHENRKAGR